VLKVLSPTRSWAYPHHYGIIWLRDSEPQETAHGVSNAALYSWTRRRKKKEKKKKTRDDRVQPASYGSASDEIGNKIRVAGFYNQGRSVLFSAKAYSWIG